MSLKKDESQKEMDSIAIKADIAKTHREYDENKENHTVDLYTINIEKDLTYIPQEYVESIPEFEPLKASVELHYSSKYPQNSATVLQIKASVMSAQGTESANNTGSVITFNGEIKTAKQWPFMPFNIENAVNAGTGDELEAYLESS